MNAIVSGTFDLPHAGHCDFLRRARMVADRLIVAINTDASVQRLKGPSRPIYTQAERLVLVSALRFVDLTLLFDTEAELAALCQEFAPCVRVVGEDYRGRAVTGAEYASAVLFLPRSAHSTSGIIGRIRAESA